MDRKSSVKDVHKYINQDMPELYKTLCNKLGDDNPFAKFSIGAGNYVWSDNRCHWSKMIDASQSDQIAIKEALFETINKVSSKVGNKTAAALFTTPDDSYIYYNNDNGVIKILLTGWGFKKPERIIIGSETKNIKKKNPVRLSFSFDGERLPNYEFIIKLARQGKHLQTDANGYYNFSNLNIGEHLILNDIQSGKDYIFDIVEGKTEYDYDVTTFTNVCVETYCDGQPLPYEQVRLCIHGKDYTSVTNNEGKVYIQVPNYIGEEVVASAREQSQQKPLLECNTPFVFRFETEKPQDINTNIVVSVSKNSLPQQSIEVVVRYAGETHRGLTERNGIFQVNTIISDEAQCVVEVDGYSIQSKLLEKQEINKFIFNKVEETQLEPPVDETKKIKPRIVVRHKNGDIVSDYGISVEYKESYYQYTTNMDGCVYLDEMEEGESMVVSSWPDRNIVEVFLLKHEQEEYVFVIPDEEITNLIKVMFRDIQGNPIKCSNVVFQQKGKNNLTLVLDEDGNTYFDEGFFNVAQPMSVRIDGWNNLESYEPIPFTLEKNEYEYLIQEKPVKKSWWKRILEILFILISIIVFFYFWFFFEGFCLGMFNAIYN